MPLAYGIPIVDDTGNLIVVISGNVFNDSDKYPNDWFSWENIPFGLNPNPPDPLNRTPLYQFSELPIEGAKYIPEYNSDLASNVNSMYPITQDVEQYVDNTYLIDEANRKFNNAVEIVNNKILYAMNLANTTTVARKKISNDIVYSVSTKAKTIIADAVNEYNNATADAKIIISSTPSRRKLLGPVAFQPIDEVLINSYAQCLKIIFNESKKGRCVAIQRVNAQGQLSLGGQLLNLDGSPVWVNFDYIDSHNNHLLGCHILTASEISSGKIILSDGRTISDWKKGETPQNEGISDEKLDLILMDDIQNAIKKLHDKIGVNRWNFLWYNDQCLLFLFLHIIYIQGSLIFDETVDLINQIYAPDVYDNDFDVIKNPTIQFSQRYTLYHADEKTPDNLIISKNSERRLKMDYISYAWDKSFQTSMRPGFNIFSEVHTIIADNFLWRYTSEPEYIIINPTKLDFSDYYLRYNGWHNKWYYPK